MYEHSNDRSVAALGQAAIGYARKPGARGARVFRGLLGTAFALAGLTLLTGAGQVSAQSDTEDSGTTESPVITISPVASEFGLGIDDVLFMLTRSGAADDVLSVPVALSQADAYLESSALDRTVTFAADASSAELKIRRNEFLSTATQSGDLTASVPAGDIPGEALSTATVRMVVANPVVTIRIEQASYSFVEGASGTNLAVVAQTAAGLPQPNLRLGVSVSTRVVTDGAVSPADFAPLSEQVTFAPGDFALHNGAWRARKEVALAIVDDTDDETDEMLNAVLEMTPGFPDRVALRKADGETACSGGCVVPVTIVDNDEPPSAPRRLTLEPADGEVTLSWEPPADDGGHAVTKYEYRVSADGGTTWDPDWTDIADSAPGQTNAASWLVTGLDNGTRYVFELRAETVVGPGEPAEGTATPVGTTTVTRVAFLPPPKTYAIGDAIRVKARFNGDVDVVASETAGPYIGIEVGESAKRAYFRRLHGSDALVFEYTVQRGDLDTDGISIAANALTVADGSAIRTAGGPVPLEHAAVGPDPTRKVDGVPPTVLSATVDGARVVLTWSEGLDESSVPSPPGGFAVTAGGSARTVSALSASGAEVTLTLSAAVENGQSVTVTYAAPGSGGAGESAGTGTESIRDVAGNRAESFSKFTVTNATAVLPEMSVAGAEANEEAALVFRVTLDRPAPGPVTVEWATADGTAEAGADYEAARDTLSFAIGEIEKTVEVVLIDDVEHEETETLALTLSNAEGAGIAVARAIGRITNADVIPGAWLARFGRTAAGQVLEAVDARLKAPRRSGLEGRIAGIRLDGARRDWRPATDDMTAGGGAAALAEWTGSESGRIGGNALPRLRTREPAGRDMILGTSFALTGGSEDGGFASVWARAAVTGFDGREGDVVLDGEVTTGMVGADYEQGPVTGGLLLSVSRGEGTYGSRGGEFEMSLAGVYPYARYAVTGRVSIWGVAGYADGDLKLTPPRGGPRETGIDLRMAAAGMRGTVLDAGESGGFELAFKSDAMVVRIDSDRTTGLAATESDVNRLRLRLEGSWHGLEVAGGTLEPSVEVGVRRDGGDAETGTGADVGGSLAWFDRQRGIAAEVEARGLLTHADEDFRERGLAGSLAWDPKPSSDLGLSMSLRQSVGASASGGVEALLGRGAPPVFADAEDGRSRLEATLGYGLPMFGGAFLGTPRVGVGMSDDSRDVSLGCRLGAVREGGREVVLDLEGMRREFEGVSRPEDRIGLWLTMRW